MRPIKLAYAPTRRSIFSAPDAVKYRNLTAQRLRELGVDFVDIDDINEEGLLYSEEDRLKMLAKFRAAGVDGLLLAGSEAGLVPLPEGRIKRRLHIGPGKLIAVDLKHGRLYDEHEAVDALAAAQPYSDWLDNMVDLEPIIGPGPEPRAAVGEALIRRQIAAGFSREDLDLLLDALVRDGKEAVGSMGDDAPPAVLSSLPRPLAHYFRQNFSQVTNPPIDPLREAGAMSLKTRFKNLGNILAQDEAQTEVFVLDSPVLTTGMYQRLLGVIADGSTTVIDCTYPVPAECDRPGAGLRQALDRIRD